MKTLENNIKKASLADMDAILSIENDAFSCPWSRDDVMSSIKNPIWTFLLFENENGALGYLSFYCVLDECYISNIAVKSEFRHQKIGSALLERAISLAWEGDMRFLSLECRESNVPAISLYEKHGFLPTGKRKRFYTSPIEDAVILTLSKKESNENFGI